MFCYQRHYTKNNENIAFFSARKCYAIIDHCGSSKRTDTFNLSAACRTFFLEKVFHRVCMLCL